MLGSLVVSVLFCLVGLFGLFVAAGAEDASAQVMGFGLVLFAWFLMVGYHARRAENDERARHGAAH